MVRHLSPRSKKRKYVQKASPKHKAKAVMVSAKKKSDPIKQLYSGDSYFDLDAAGKRLANKMLKSGSFTALTYSLHPTVLKWLQPAASRYIMFVDSRRADCYAELKKYLEDNRDKYSAFCTVGDSDFVIQFTANEDAFQLLYDKLFEIHKAAPTEKDTSELFQVYKVKQDYLIWRIRTPAEEPADDIRASIDSLAKIEATIGNYLGDTSKAEFKNDSRLEQFLTNLRNRKALLGFHVIRDFVPDTIRAYILVLYAQAGLDRHILRNSDISSKIIDFFQISPHKVTEEFYNKVDAVIVADFSSVSEYHDWKEHLYTFLLQCGQNINVMTFIVENVISELAYQSCDYLFFRELCDTYSKIPRANRIVLGTPIFRGAIQLSPDISLDMSRLREHGLILGIQGSGKTVTALAIAGRLVAAGVHVHMLDSTGGVDTAKVREACPVLLDTYQVKWLKDQELASLSSIDYSTTAGLNVYAPSQSNLIRIARVLIGSIASSNTAGRETKDVIFIEEAHGLFKDGDFVAELFAALRTAGRQGVSIWISTHHLSDLPVSDLGAKSHHLSSELHNLVVHKIDEAEMENVIKVLVGSDKSEYPSLQSLKGLPPGQAFVSASVAKNGGSDRLKPMLTKIIVTET